MLNNNKLHYLYFLLMTFIHIYRYIVFNYKCKVNIITQIKRSKLNDIINNGFLVDIFSIKDQPSWSEK